MDRYKLTRASHGLISLMQVYVCTATKLMLEGHTSFQLCKTVVLLPWCCK
jgi:hypothetical protein